MPEGFIRTLDTDLSCPTGLDGEFHGDGNVWGAFLWEVRTALGKDKLDALFMGVVGKITADVTFASLAQILIDDATTALGAADAETIRGIAASRGMLDCTRFVPLTTTPHNALVIGKEMLEPYGISIAFIPGEIHYTIDVPAEAKTLDLHLATSPEMNVDVVILVRADQPVEHQLSFIPPSTIDLVSTFDFKLTQKWGTYDLLNPQVASPFEPGHKYYLHPVDQERRSTRFSFSGSVSTDVQDGGTDAGTDAGVDAGSDPGPDAGMDAGTDAGKDGGGGDSGADAGGDAPGCPQGYSPEVINGQPECVPICVDGYEPVKENGEWTCVSSGSGCGCNMGGTMATLLPCALLLLALGLRKRGN
jgi:hypothetical protein